MICYVLKTDWPQFHLDIHCWINLILDKNTYFSGTNNKKCHLRVCS